MIAMLCWKISASNHNTFTVLHGGCRLDGVCFYSPNYPSEYGDNAYCILQANHEVTLRVVDFFTERGFDFLTVGNIDYSGSAGPIGVVVPIGGQVVFDSDESLTERGFKICDADGVCGAGEYILDGSCEMCETGTYSSDGTADSCTSCPRGTSSPRGAASSDSCSGTPLKVGGGAAARSIVGIVVFVAMTMVCVNIICYVRSGGRQHRRVAPGGGRLSSREPSGVPSSFPRALIGRESMSSPGSFEMSSMGRGGASRSPPSRAPSRQPPSTPRAVRIDAPTSLIQHIPIAFVVAGPSSSHISSQLPVLATPVTPYSD